LNLSAKPDIHAHLPPEENRVEGRLGNLHKSLSPAARAHGTESFPTLQVELKNVFPVGLNFSLEKAIFFERLEALIEVLSLETVQYLQIVVRRI
jgi:hypothetical protein